MFILGQLHGGISDQLLPSSLHLADDARVQLRVVIGAKSGDIAQENWEGTLRGLLDPAQSAQIGSRIGQACELTFRNVVIRFNSATKEPEIRTPCPTSVACDWSTVERLLGGQEPYPLDCLPYPVGLFVRSLAERCSVPECVPATTCLALASGLAGAGFKLDRGLGAPVGVNLYFGVGVDPNSNFRAAVESVLRPAQQLQEERMGGGNESGWPTPSRGLLEEWKREQNGEEGPSLLLSAGSPAEGWKELLESSSEGLFHYCWDEELMLELIERAEKPKGDPASTILKKAYRGELFSTRRDRKKKRPRQAQSIGLLWLCSPEGLARFARCRPLLRDGVLRCFILFDSEAEPAQLTTALLEPTQGAIEWERSLRDIVSWCSESEGHIWQSDREGAGLLGIFSNVVLKKMRATAAPEYWMVPEWVDRAWRMTGLVHLLSGRFGAVIEPETPWKGLCLAAWYLGQQLRGYGGSRAKPTKVVTKMDVLERLRKGPLSDPEFLHAFHCFKAAERDRITAELRQEGEIRKDDGGRWVVCESAAAPG